MSSRKIKREEPGIAALLPIAFILFVVPMIVYMGLTKLSPAESAIWGNDVDYPDFFNYIKSQWFMVASVIALIVFVGYLAAKKLEIKKSFIYIPTGSYALLIVLSTIFSTNRDIALKGFMARYEGMFVLLCYLACMVIVMNLVESEKQVQFLMKALIASALVIGLIGLFQLFKLDLFRSEFGKRLIIPAKYYGYVENVDFRFEESYIYSTLTNPNYVGSYMVMLIPIAVTILIYVKQIWLKAGMAALILIFTANMFGSRSRAGLVGVIVAVFLGIIVLRKYIFKKKVIFLGITAAAIAAFLIINVSLNGLLTNRIVNEFKILFSDDAQFYDLKDITFEGNKVSIVGDTETLNIVLNGNLLNFYDTNGNLLDTNQTTNDNNEMYVSFIDENYKGYNITIKDSLLVLNQKNVTIEFWLHEGGISLIGNNKKLVNQINKAPFIGFEGKERLGSARGYIWSRSIPMLKNSVIFGYGPDTFAVEFPQEDYIGKIRAYGTPRMIVDKPHNMYLQIAVNTGVLSLLAFLTICGAYIIESIRIYFRKLDNSFACLAGAGIFLGICGYLTAAVFNDSIVSIAPVFWILLGTGFACNRIVNKHRKINQKVI